MKKIAVIIYGPPGSGKSTQSSLVAHALGLLHFDTGKYIEITINDPGNANDKIIQKQKKRYESGLLCEKPWVLSIVSEQAKKIIRSGYGIVLSGSPRTTYEAFGNNETQGIYSILEDAYGKNNIFVFQLKINPEDSIFRNKERKICSVCGKPILYIEGIDIQECPFCKGPLRVRRDDKPEIIKDRIEEFKKETEPIFERLRKQGYKVREIDGRLPPYKVFGEITKWLK